MVLFEAEFGYERIRYFGIIYEFILSKISQIAKKTGKRTFTIYYGLLNILRFVRVMSNKV